MRVSGDDVFWHTLYDADPYIRQAVYEICFGLVDFGIPANAGHTQAALGPVLVPARTVDLPGGEAFLTCVGPEVVGEGRVYVATFTYYDWEDD